MKLTMTKSVLTVAVSVFAGVWSADAALVAAWDFPTLTAAPSTPSTFSATVGSGTLDVSAFASTASNPQRTMFGGTTVNAFAGGDAGSTAALALANNSANGKSAVFTLDMSLYQNLVLSFATQGTSTGFNTHQWAYSTDGATYTTLSGNNTAVTVSGFVTKSVDFSSITALNGDSSVYIMLTVSGATGTSGNNRFDNIQFNADLATAAVPEPSTWFAGALLALPFGVHGVRYLRNRKQA